MKFEDVILSSFVYSGSSRKSAILAAANNPINTELVTQLVGYLDEQYLKPKEEVQSEPKAEPEVVSDEPSAEPAPPVAQPPRGGGSFSLSDDSRSLASMFGDDLDTPEETPESEPEGPDGATPESESEPEPEVELSVDVPVTLDSICASATSMLNAVTATAGVRSAKIQGSELWIYYKDDINLNGVMESVIDSLPEDIVEFNRLARSHNAIVFTQRG